MPMLDVASTFRSCRRRSFSFARAIVVWFSVSIPLGAGADPAPPHFERAQFPPVLLRADGMLLLDGQPFFPVGLVDIGAWYWRYTEDWNQRIRDSHANVVWDIQAAYADTLPTCAALVDSANAAGYKLVVGSGDTWKWDDLATPEYEVDKRLFETDELESMLDCLGASPGTFIGFANRDEPVWTLSKGWLGDIDEEHIHDTYAQLHDAVDETIVAMNFAPVHLSLDLETWKNDIRSYRNATDVMMFACYPYPAGPGTCGEQNVVGYPACAMDRLPLAADLFLSELNAPGQPLWMIVQAHKSVTYQIARWEAVAAFVHGATGVLWAGWPWEHALGNGWLSWDDVSRCIRDFESLQPFLVGTDLSGAVTNNADVEVRAKRSAGPHVAVFAISRNEFTGDASIYLPELPSRGNTFVTVAHEGRQVQAVNGWITDHFDGYEAHVYRYLEARYVDPRLASGEDDVEAPASFAVRAFPNPTRGSTVVGFDLGRPAAVLFQVYDAAGRRVALAGHGNFESGTGEVRWDGRDLQGNLVAPGVYFIRGRTSGGEEATARILLRR